MTTERPIIYLIRWYDVGPKRFRYRWVADPDGVEALRDWRAVRGVVGETSVVNSAVGDSGTASLLNGQQDWLAGIEAAYVGRYT